MLVRTERNVATPQPTPPPKLAGPGHHAGAAAAAFALECRRKLRSRHRPPLLLLRRARGRHAILVRRVGEDDGQDRAAETLRYCRAEGEAPLPSTAATLLRHTPGRTEKKTLLKLDNVSPRLQLPFSSCEVEGHFRPFESRVKSIYKPKEPKPEPQLDEEEEDESDGSKFSTSTTENAFLEADLVLIELSLSPNDPFGE
nr:hypothetical protein Iba_chr05cCG12400 [Ipomoea batatas]